MAERSESNILALNQRGDFVDDEGVTRTKNGKRVGRAPKADWEAVKADYCAGILTIREVAEKHGLSHATVGKRAKGNPARNEPPWERDLTHRIRRRVQRVINEPVAVPNDTSMSGAGNLPGPDDPEEAVVTSAANRAAAVLKSHRKLIGRARRISHSLMHELETQTMKIEDFKNFAVQVAKSLGEDGKPDELLLRKWMSAMTADNRIGMLEELSRAIKTLVAAERIAYGLTDDGKNDEDDTPYEKMMRELHNMGLADAGGRIR